MKITQESWRKPARRAAWSAVPVAWAAVVPAASAAWVAVWVAWSAVEAACEVAAVVVSAAFAAWLVVALALYPVVT